MPCFAHRLTSPVEPGPLFPAVMAIGGRVAALVGKFLRREVTDASDEFLLTGMQPVPAPLGGTTVRIRFGRASLGMESWITGSYSTSDRFYRQALLCARA